MEKQCDMTYSVVGHSEQESLLFYNYFKICL